MRDHSHEELLIGHRHPRSPAGDHRDPVLSHARYVSGRTIRAASALVRQCRTRAGEFGRGEHATAALEFALVGPLFFALMLEVFQFGLYFYNLSNLDRATAAAARQILTGVVGNQNLTSSQFIQNVLCPNFSGSSCASKVIVNLVNVPETSQGTGYYSLINSPQTGLINPPMNNAQTSFCPGFSGGYNPTTSTSGAEVLEVFYPMPVVSLFWLSISTSLSGSAVFYVRSVITFQNEPYAVNGQAGGC